MFKTKIDAACQLHQNEAKKLHILRQSTPAEVFNLLREVAAQNKKVWWSPPKSSSKTARCPKCKKQKIWKWRRQKVFFAECFAEQLPELHIPRKSAEGNVCIYAFKKTLWISLNYFGQSSKKEHHLGRGHFWVKVNLHLSRSSEIHLT